MRYLLHFCSVMRQIQKKTRALGIHQNERGAAVLITVILSSVCLVMLLSAIYIYVVNRAKYHARIKAAYAAQGAIEEAARIMRQAYDASNGTNWKPTNMMVPNPPPAGSACPGNTFPVTGSDGKTYCFGMRMEPLPGHEGELVATGVEAQMLEYNGELKGEKTRAINGTIARLDGFFDDTLRAPASFNDDSDLLQRFQKPRIFGWLRRGLSADQAMAQTVSNYPNHTNTPAGGSDHGNTESPPPWGSAMGCAAPPTVAGENALQCLGQNKKANGSPCGDIICKPGYNGASHQCTSGETCWNLNNMADYQSYGNWCQQKCMYCPAGSMACAKISVSIGTASLGQAIKFVNAGDM